MLTLQGKNLQSMQTIQVDLEVISATYVFIEITLQNFLTIGKNCKSFVHNQFLNQI